MAYTKKTWIKGEIIKATDLNNIEEGIEESSFYLTVQVPVGSTYPVLCYKPSENDDPIDDADEIVRLLLDKRVKWVLSFNGRSYSIVSIVLDDQLENPKVTTADGTIWVTNSNNQIEYSGSYGLYQYEHDGKLVLALEDILGNTTTYSPGDIIEYLTNDRNGNAYVYYDDTGVNHIIVSYDPQRLSITCDNGDIFIEETIGAESLFVKQDFSGTLMMLHRTTMFIDNSDKPILALLSPDWQDQITEPSDIVRALLSGTTPWVIIEEVNAVPIKKIYNCHAADLDGTYIECDECEYHIDAQNNVFIDTTQPQYEVKEITSSNRTYSLAAFDDISDLPTPTPYVLQSGGYYADAVSTTIAGLRMAGGVSPSINGAILKVDGGSTVDFNPGALDISYAMCEFNQSMNQPIGGANPNTWLTESRTLKSTTAYIGIQFKVNSGEMTDAIRNQLLSTIEIVSNNSEE